MCKKSYHIKMIWLSPNEGHLHQTNVTIRLLRINLGRVTRIFVMKGWRFEMVAASDGHNQSVCMLQKHVFCRQKVKEWNEHVYSLPWGNSKHAQKKSDEELSNMHKIARGSFENAQNPTRNFQNVHNPMRNSQICTILRGTSNNVQHPTRIFRKCTKSHD